MQTNKDLTNLRSLLFLGLELCAEVSRVRVQATKRHKREEDTWGYAQTSSLHVTGRIVLNIWRLMRVELTLTMYSYPHVVFHVLHQR